MYVWKEFAIVYKWHLKAHLNYREKPNSANKTSWRLIWNNYTIAVLYILIQCIHYVIEHQCSHMTNDFVQCFIFDHFDHFWHFDHTNQNMHIYYSLQYVFDISNINKHKLKISILEQTYNTLFKITFDLSSDKNNIPERDVELRAVQEPNSTK